MNCEIYGEKIYYLNILMQLKFKISKIKTFRIAFTQAALSAWKIGVDA